MKTITDLRFLGDWSLWTTLFCALFLAVAAWVFYRRELRDRATYTRWLLPTLRATAVFLLVLMLAGPVLHHRHTIGELARVMIFLDSSQSMGVTDDFMDPTRKLQTACSYGWLSSDSLKSNRPGTPLVELLKNKAWASAIEKFDSTPRWQRMESLLLDEHDGLLPRLVQKHNVELWSISDAKPQRLWSIEQGTPLPKNLPAKPEGDSTDLSDAIASRLGQRQDERAAIVLISDGQHNQGSSPIETAKAAGGRNTPLFTVGVGALERPGDLALIGVSAPETVFVEDRVRGEISIKDDMDPGQPFVVRIEENGRTLWEKSLVTERNHRRRIEFEFPIKELVEARKKSAEGVEFTNLPLAMKVSIPPIVGEKDKSNNESQLRFRAITRRCKLLLLEGRPRWEFRYIRNMFERDPQWEVSSLMAGTSLTDQWQRGNAPGQFPLQKEALFAYDLIGFGEVPEKLLNEEELGWIKEFVNARGGGLVFVDGQLGLLRSYASGPLGPLFPVEWTGASRKEIASGLQLTDRGAAFAPLRLTADATENATLWRGLRPPHWVASTKALAGSETLVEAVVGNQKLPAIVWRQFGAGRVLYLGMDECWRWRYNVADQHHDPFWHQMANAIMEQPFAVRDKFVALDAGSANYQAGDTAEIRVRLSDDQGRTIVQGNPTAHLYRGEEKVATLSLSNDGSSGGVFRGKTGKLAPGDYEVRVDARGLVPDRPGVRVAFHVQGKNGDVSRELSELNCNEELLQQMARVSAGEYFREEAVSKLIEKLEPLSKGRVEESDTVLWQSWWWFCPIILLLTVEWILRKRVGLI